MPVGHTNYASAYATGLLLARRLLTKLDMANKYEGLKEITGTDYNVEELADGPRPFTALLDVGLHRTTTGSKVFGALKGATDGGLFIPHKETRFVGYDSESKKLDSEVLRKHIFGSHVADYMKLMKEQNPSKFETHFSEYVKAGINPDELDKLWAKVHQNIRNDPVMKKTEKHIPKLHKRFKKVKMSLAQRKDRVKQKLNSKKAKEEK
jgi:large subunit ribosomal protein L5e